MKNLVLKEKMSESISEFSLPRYDEINNVGLYLEQVAEYINFYLSPLGEAEITVSMISNYVKQKIVDAPLKKQYYNTQIAQLIFVSVIKLTAALEDIRLMFDVQRATYDIKTAYDYFCDEFENTLKYAFGVTKNIKKCGITESGAKDLLHNGINSVVTKIYFDKYMTALRINRELFEGI